MNKIQERDEQRKAALEERKKNEESESKSVQTTLFFKQLNESISSIKNELKNAKEFKEDDAKEFYKGF